MENLGRVEGIYMCEYDKRDGRDYDWINRLTSGLEYDGRLGDGGDARESRDGNPKSASRFCRTPKRAVFPCS
jgi:hypothetical protein